MSRRKSTRYEVVAEDKENDSDRTPQKRNSRKSASVSKTLDDFETDESSSVRKSGRMRSPNKKYASDQFETNFSKPEVIIISESESSQTNDSEVNQEEPKARKSVRKKTPNKKYSPEEFIQESAKSKSRQKNVVEVTDDCDDDDDDDDSDLEEIAEKVKATTLFEERVDVEGQNIYGFKTPKKRDGMNLLATNTPKTPKTPKTPSVSTTKSVSKSKITKTPHRDRTQLKKKITKMVQYDSGSDFSASESDFVPSSSSSSSSSESSDQEDSNDEEEEDKPKKQPVKIVPISTPTVTTRRRKGRQKADLQYVLQSDEYFSSHASTKTVTSDHTLDRLKTPRLPHDRLFGLLRDMQVSKEHEKAIQELQEDYKLYFNKWLYLMNEGFNILLYGLGSKRNLLKSFHRLMLKNQPVIVVNGFFPSLTVKDILDSITDDILDMTVNSSNLHEIVDIIQEEFRYIPDTHLFLIVHNLDGTMLRNGKAQNIISRLASIGNIHLLASIDHINTPLIWDSSKLSNYNFSWWDTTTMLPYSDETAYENSLLVQNSGSLALSSMKNVFLSLTTNARGIFMVIVKNQIENKGNPNYQGLPFKDLYWSCREAFLVSSDLALRAQLTEFLDHKLVKMKRGNDGIEHLNIPIEHGLLQQFVEQEQ